MSDNKQYIVDEHGKIQSVILDYESFRKMEELLLDAGLVKAMDEVQGEEELTWEETKLRAQQIDSQNSKKNTSD